LACLPELGLARTSQLAARAAWPANKVKMTKTDA